MKKRILPTRLVRERRTWALNQRELAALLGHESASYISRIERRAVTPSFRAAIACQLLFGLPGRKLFPELFDQVAEDVATRAYELHTKLSPSKTLSNLKKMALLSRVIERVNHHNSLNSQSHEESSR